MPVIGDGMVSTAFQPNEHRHFPPETGYGSGGFSEELNLGELFALRLGKIVIGLNLEP
jgi:hypothetical protein